MFGQGLVAGFLRDCGYAAKTEYGTSSSSNLNQALGAFKRVFAYKGDRFDKFWAWFYSWSEKLRTEINQGRPVFYSGRGSQGGHAFVVDGYKANDPAKFHINWGWNGHEKSRQTKYKTTKYTTTRAFI